MNHLLIISVIFFVLNANSNIDSKIKKTSSKLNTYSKNYKNINQKMAQNAKEILEQKLEISMQEKHLKNLKNELSQKEISYKVNTTELTNLKKSENSLKEDSEKLEQELVFTIAQSVSLSVILEEEYTTSEESLIEFEVLRAMLKNAKMKITELNDKFYINSKNIEDVNAQVSTLEVEIAIIDGKRKEMLNIQEKNKKDLKNLKVAKSSYKKELQKVLKKQDSLKTTLARLNIIKIDEIKKAKQEAERARAFNSNNIILDKNLPKVKKHGSSYQAIKTKKYRGLKTISPFSPYEITKKYGTYTDPIYGIKVFNESISLKPNKKNTKVKTVFNGKIIYADKTAVLDNIVIVEHKYGLHTIYANLSQISPNIKKGKKIKKGYTIGRVSDELIFEVTQKSFHINPVKLFQ
ncbi:peptidoglycan DD-metalloendopeptidase family protein [Candidatus Sulfurimonas marisnigri]|uniref:Peptidoglycan DD-metalloendopeptidase family protein n=1 Tax=Candidatus Sulfurimonas marisnigri TaxID=2740405 RepID=A0A7S7RRB2_9BACT|nr:peptidoglycan DD-metalloendopeptidase family protein [Candidatus Sulfurimonas marisnigri]QOY55544.1 peptidoglycan DD-metalloendopeptidase family protein [Candidatus Sulfurimonas marisnigri]